MEYYTILWGHSFHQIFGVKGKSLARLLLRADTFCVRNYARCTQLSNEVFRRRSSFGSALSVIDDIQKIRLEA